MGQNLGATRGSGEWLGCSWSWRKHMGESYQLLMRWLLMGQQHHGALAGWRSPTCGRRDLLWTYSAAQQQAKRLRAAAQQHAKRLHAAPQQQAKRLHAAAQQQAKRLQATASQQAKPASCQKLVGCGCERDSYASGAWIEWRRQAIWQLLPWGGAPETRTEPPICCPWAEHLLQAWRQTQPRLAGVPLGWTLAEELSPPLRSL